MLIIINFFYYYFCIFFFFMGKKKNAHFSQAFLEGLEEGFSVAQLCEHGQGLARWESLRSHFGTELPPLYFV